MTDSYKFILADSLTVGDEIMFHMKNGRGDECRFWARVESLHDNNQLVVLIESAHNVDRPEEEVGLLMLAKRWKMSRKELDSLNVARVLKAQAS